MDTSSVVAISGNRSAKAETRALCDEDETATPGRF
jgi:hypothetical protein